MKRLIAFIRSTALLLTALLTYDYVKILWSHYLASHEQNESNISHKDVKETHYQSSCALLEQKTFNIIEESKESPTNDDSQIHKKYFSPNIEIAGNHLLRPNSSEENGNNFSCAVAKSVLEDHTEIFAKKWNIYVQKCQENRGVTTRKILAKRRGEKKEHCHALYGLRSQTVHKSKNNRFIKMKIADVKGKFGAHAYRSYGLAPIKKEEKKGKDIHEFLCSVEKLERTVKEVGLLAQNFNKEEQPVFLASNEKPKENFFAGNFYSRDEPPKEEIPQGNPYPRPKQTTIRHIKGTGDGIGFMTNYSTLAVLLASDYREGHFMPMIDLRGHRFDDTSYAANVGIAGRYIPKRHTFCEMLGVNVFYDYRGGEQGNFNQIGAGVEVLGRRWDFRANGYVPVGRSKIKKKCIFNHYDHDVDESFIITNEKCEFTSYGFNAEVGYLIVNAKIFSLYLAAGPYYLARQCDESTQGIMARAKIQLKDYFAVEGFFSHDPVFQTVWQWQFSVNVPFYQISTKKNRKPPCRLKEQQVYQPIMRFEVMPLGRKDCWKSEFHQGSDETNFDGNDNDDEF